MEKILQKFHHYLYRRRKVKSGARQGRLKSGLFLLFLLLLSFNTTLHAEDDFQQWSWFDLKLIDTKYVDFTNHSELRFYEDSSEFGLWFTSQKLSVDAFKYLSFGVNYSYLEYQSKVSKAGETEFKYQHRFELEANPKFTFKNGWKISNRNRMEFRWIEDKGSDHGRFRQRWQFDIPVKRYDWLKSVYANNEYFVDFNTHEINENRAVPAGINFKVNDHIGLGLFYMIQSRKGAKDWSSNQILGTKVNVSL